MLQCGTHLIFGHVELPGKMRPARHQLAGLDGDALPLLAAPVGREQQVKVKAGGVRLGVPLPVGQPSRKRHKTAAQFNVQSVFLLSVFCSQHNAPGSAEPVRTFFGNFSAHRCSTKPEKQQKTCLRKINADRSFLRAESGKCAGKLRTAHCRKNVQKSTGIGSFCPYARSGRMSGQRFSSCRMASKQQSR